MSCSAKKRSSGTRRFFWIARWIWTASSNSSATERDARSTSCAGSEAKASTSTGWRPGSSGASAAAASVGADPGPPCVGAASSDNSALDELVRVSGLLEVGAPGMREQYSRPRLSRGLERVAEERAVQLERSVVADRARETRLDLAVFRLTREDDDRSRSHAVDSMLVVATTTTKEKP